MGRRLIRDMSVHLSVRGSTIGVAQVVGTSIARAAGQHIVTNA